MYNVLTGDPGYLAKDFARYRQVSPQGVQRAAKKYLSANNVVLEVTPGAELKITPDPLGPAAEARERLAKSVTETPVPISLQAPENADRLNMPKPEPEPQFKAPLVKRAKLSNGMSLIVVENHELPAVSVHITFPFGSADVPAEKLGLAGLTASVWDGGTEKRTAEQIAEELADIGARLSINADSDDTSARLYVLKTPPRQSLGDF